MKKNRKIYIAVISFILIILLVIYTYKNISIQKNTEDEYQDYTPQEEISDEQMRQTKVILYFENINSGELEAETKLVDANTLIKEPEKELMNLLIKGPQSSNLKKLIPEGTVVHNITINNSLNFSIPSFFCKSLKMSIIDCASLCSLIKANIKEQFTKCTVSKTFPPFLPMTVSISTIGVSGFSSINFL